MTIVRATLRALLPVILLASAIYGATRHRASAGAPVPPHVEVVAERS